MINELIASIDPVNMTIFVTSTLGVMWPVANAIEAIDQYIQNRK